MTRVPLTSNLNEIGQFGLGATIGNRYKIKTIFLVSGIFPGKADSVIMLGFECTINPQNLMKIIGAIFQKMNILNFFIMGTSLNFEGRPKTKKRPGDICKVTPDTEFEQHCSVGLRAMLGDGQKIKNYFSSFRDFCRNLSYCWDSNML